MTAELIEGVNARYCTKCGDLKSFEEFSKKKGGKYGLDSRCKNCRNNYLKKHYENNKEYYSKRMKKYYENNRDRLMHHNKEWRINNKDYYYEYYKKNIEKHRISSRNYKAKKNNALGNFTEKEFKEISLEFFDWKCAYTGEPILKDLSNCHREHIIPLSKGGDNGIWNIVPSLDWVNLSKNNSNMEEWYKKQPYFSEERLERIYEYMRIMEEKYFLKKCI